MSHGGRERPQVHMVTQARRSLSDDISFRQRRYLLMMGIRAVCFVIAVVMFINHLGWLAAVPAIAAIFIPYFAVVIANGGREPNNTRGFMEYNPRLPARSDLLAQRPENTRPPTPPGSDGDN
jgi:Protein of unknown function (DUF3099)